MNDFSVFLHCVGLISEDMTTIAADDELPWGVLFGIRLSCRFENRIGIESSRVCQSASLYDRECFEILLIIPKNAVERDQFSSSGQFAWYFIQLKFRV